MTWSTEPESAPPRRWKRTEYDQLVELGFFGDERVELIEGEILTMSPQGVRHGQVIQKLTRSFRRLPDSAELRVQLSFAAGDASRPEPDLAIVPADAIDRTDLATTALLVVEVAEASLRYDLGLKAAVYAAADVREYWVVDLKARTLIVHRDSDGTRWTATQTLHIGDAARPVAFPDLSLPLEDFIPAG